jgi:hypothetical protein
MLSLFCNIPYTPILNLRYTVPDLGGGAEVTIAPGSTSKGDTHIEKEGTTQVVNNLFLADLIHHKVV